MRSRGLSRLLGIVCLVGGALPVGVGCTITVAGSDAGSDAATGDAVAQTVGDQCSTIVTEFCTQAATRCATGASLADCIANDMPMCCAGTACNSSSQSSAATVSACTTAIDGEDCNSVVSLGLPAACQGVPQAQ